MRTMCSKAKDNRLDGWLTAGHTTDDGERETERRKVKERWSLLWLYWLKKRGELTLGHDEQNWTKGGQTRACPGIPERVSVFVGLFKATVTWQGAPVQVYWRACVALLRRKRSDLQESCVFLVMYTLEHQKGGKHWKTASKDILPKTAQLLGNLHIHSKKWVTK